jgi:hypothetical protein
VVENISLKQVKNARILDFKKKLLKSKDMQDYFDNHQNEREMILQDIMKLSTQITMKAIKCDQEVPEYLIPKIIKEQRKLNEDQVKTKKKVLVKQANMDKDYEKKLKKRVENNNLTMDDIKKKRKVNTD